MEREPRWSHFAVSLFSCLSRSQEERPDSLQLQMAPASLGEPPGPICIILPSKPPLPPAAAPASQQLRLGLRSLGARALPQLGWRTRKGNPQGASKQWAARGSCPTVAFLLVPHSTQQFRPANTAEPHSYPGKEARLVAAAPLRSCRHFGSEK